MAKDKRLAGCCTALSVIAERARKTKSGITT